MKPIYLRVIFWFLLLAFVANYILLFAFGYVFDKPGYDGGHLLNAVVNAFSLAIPFSFIEYNSSIICIEDGFLKYRKFKNDKMAPSIDLKDFFNVRVGFFVVVVSQGRSKIRLFKLYYSSAEMNDFVSIIGNSITSRSS